MIIAEIIAIVLILRNNVVGVGAAVLAVIGITRAMWHIRRLIKKTE